MRILVLLALASCLAWSAGEYVAVNPEAPPVLTPDYASDMELSRDNGNIASAWVYINGANTYAGCQYDTPSGGWYLYGIKYNVWSQGWPDSTYQGFAVACWKMVSGTPGDVVWPTSGTPIYNPNTGGNWIIQDIPGGLNLSTAAPNGFVVGIGFLYTYPANDAFGVDNTGPGPYDWAQASGTWQAPPYGKGSARALITQPPGPWNPYVEPTSLGCVRAFYR